MSYMRKGEYWALEWDSMRSSSIDPHSLSFTRRNAWSKAIRENATDAWKREVARRRRAGRIRVVKVRIEKVTP